MTDDYLAQGIAAVKAGKIQEARKLLDAAIRAAPNDERTWGWFYNVCINDKERIRCLKEVLRINPDNQAVKKKYDELIKQAPSASPPIHSANPPIKKPKPSVPIFKGAFFKQPIAIIAIIATILICIACIGLLMANKTNTLRLTTSLPSPTNKPMSSPTVTMLPAATIAPIATIAPATTSVPIAIIPPSATASPIPLPTNTQLPTDTPFPTDTPLPTDTATPAPEPINLTGSGNSVVNVSKWDGPALLDITYTGGSNFVVYNYNSSGEQIDLLVNTIGQYKGIRPIDFRENESTTRLEIKASGSWKIRVLPLAYITKVTIPGTYKGTGDNVIALAGGNPDLLSIDASTATENIVVYSYGYSAELLVNEIAPYTGTVMLSSDTLVLEIQATGSWNIQITTK